MLRKQSSINTETIIINNRDDAYFRAGLKTNQKWDTRQQRYIRWQQGDGVGAFQGPSGKNEGVD